MLRWQSPGLEAGQVSKTLDFKNTSSDCPALGLFRLYSRNSPCEHHVIDLVWPASCIPNLQWVLLWEPRQRLQTKADTFLAKNSPLMQWRCTTWYMFFTDPGFCCDSVWQLAVIWDNRGGRLQPASHPPSPGWAGSQVGDSFRKEKKEHKETWGSCWTQLLLPDGVFNGSRKTTPHSGLRKQTLPLVDSRTKTKGSA